MSPAERRAVRVAIDARRRELVARPTADTCRVNRRRLPFTGWSAGCRCETCAGYALRYGAPA